LACLVPDLDPYPLTLLFSDPVRIRNTGLTVLLIQSREMNIYCILKSHEKNQLFTWDDGYKIALSSDIYIKG
jgi:hypothetical protein